MRLLTWRSRGDRCVLPTALQGFGYKARRLRLLNEHAQIARAGLSTLWRAHRLPDRREPALRHPQALIGLGSRQKRLLYTCNSIEPLVKKEVQGCAYLRPWKMPQRSVGLINPALSKRLCRSFRARVAVCG
jgi:hypothetical protein